jgi:hypothetical protein
MSVSALALSTVIFTKTALIKAQGIMGPGADGPYGINTHNKMSFFISYGKVGDYYVSTPTRRVPRLLCGAKTPLRVAPAPAALRRFRVRLCATDPVKVWSGRRCY